MSAVSHGRRRGQIRASPEMPLEMSRSQPNVQTTGLPDTSNLAQVTILSKDDWSRIQRQLNKQAIEEEKRKQAREEKEKLHALSKERVKAWSNTIAGQRQKKLQARKLREEREEEERKLIDVEEAKYQAEKRREAIEKAKTQQYYQTDRVKGFHGALLLTEVLKEREAQIELKRLKEKASEGNEDQWLKQAKADHEEGILRDQELARGRLEKTRNTAKQQKAQIEVHRKAQQQEIEEEQKEGEELQRLAAQYQDEVKKLAEIRKAEARQLRLDNFRQREDHRRMQDLMQKQEQEEDEECRIFATAKRKMMKLRAEKEEELKQEKLEELERIREKLYIQKKQAVDDEDERLQRAIEESEAKRAKEEAEKEAWNRRMHKEMGEHRNKQMKDKEDKARQDRIKELEMLAARKQADQVFAQNEEIKNQNKFQEAKGLQHYLLSQMDEKQQNISEERTKQLAVDQENVDIINQEEHQFQEYARKVINHAERGGRNTYPLKKAAMEGAGGGLGPVFPGKGGIRPSYMVCDQTGVQMPNYQRGSTNEVKQTINGDVKTNKRLGFVW